MKTQLELLNNTLNAERGLHDLEALVKEAEQDHGGPEQQSSVNIYTAAIDAGAGALRSAEDSENIGM